MTKQYTGTFLIKGVADSDFGPSFIKIDVESEDGKTLTMWCRKVFFREEYVGRKVLLTYGNPFKFGVFYQIFSIRLEEENNAQD